MFLNFPQKENENPQGDIINESAEMNRAASEDSIHSNQIKSMSGDSQAFLHNQTKIFVQSKITERLVLEDLQQLLAQQNWQMQDTQKTINEWTNYNEDLETKIQIDSLQFAELQSKIQNTKDICDALKTIVETVEKTVAGKRNESEVMKIKSLQQKAHILQSIQTFKREYTQLKDNLHRKLEQLQSQQNRSTEINIINKEKMEINRKLNEKRNFLTELTASNGKLDEERATNKNELNNLITEKESLCQTLHEIKNEINTVQGEKQKRENEYKTHEAAILNDKDKQLEGLNEILKEKEELEKSIQIEMDKMRSLSESCEVIKNENVQLLKKSEELQCLHVEMEQLLQHKKEIVEKGEVANIELMNTETSLKGIFEEKQNASELLNKLQMELAEKFQQKNNLVDDKVKCNEHLTALQQKLHLEKHQYELLMKEREIVKLNLNTIISQNEKIAENVTLIQSYIENYAKDSKEKESMLNKEHTTRIEELNKQKHRLGNSLNVVKRKLINIRKQNEYWEKKLILRRLEKCSRSERKTSLTVVQNIQTDAESLAQVSNINNVEMSTAFPTMGILVKSPGQKSGSPKRVQFTGIQGSNSTASAELGSDMNEKKWTLEDLINDLKSSTNN